MSYCLILKKTVITDKLLWYKNNKTLQDMLLKNVTVVMMWLCHINPALIIFL